MGAAYSGAGRGGGSARVALARRAARLRDAGKTERGEGDAEMAGKSGGGRGREGRMTGDKGRRWGCFGATGDSAASATVAAERRCPKISLGDGAFICYLAYKNYFWWSE